MVLMLLINCTIDHVYVDDRAFLYTQLEVFMYVI